MATRRGFGTIGILRLHEVSLEHFCAISTDPQDALKDIANISEELVPVLRRMAEQSYVFYESNRSISPWLGYLAIERETKQIVGTVGFKGEPNRDGEVEIAYWTFEPNEGRGVATSMVANLCRIASRQEGLRLIIAHTLPVQNASGRVLEKNGFVKTGHADDPHYGPVWRWERNPC